MVSMLGNYVSMKHFFLCGGGGGGGEGQDLSSAEFAQRMKKVKNFQNAHYLTDCHRRN